MLISRPNNMSRRGFLRNVLGIATAVVLPAAKVVAPEYGPSIITPRLIRELRNLYVAVDWDAIRFPFIRANYPRPKPQGEMVNGVWRVHPRYWKVKLEDMQA